METNYYTDAEMLEKLDMLHKQGKPLTDICNDERCQPDIKNKLTELDELDVKFDLLSKALGGNE